MTEAAQGVVALVATSVVVAAAVHTCHTSYLRASLIAATMASIVFQFLAYWHVGYLDPFFPIALLTGGAIAWGIALVVGLPFRRTRSRIPRDRS